MKKHISCLDGIRGGLALWVFSGHLCTAVGAKIPVLSAPALAVDLFMLVSGFLMVYHHANCHGALSTDDDEFVFRWSEVKKFWVRRFFRIAPLYYFLLPFSFFIGSNFKFWTKQIEATFPPPWADKLSHCAEPIDAGLSFLNVLSHLTFSFGLFPQYASNNSLPDWSLSLEMQFYFLFPLADSRINLKTFLI